MVDGALYVEVVDHHLGEVEAKELPHGVVPPDLSEGHVGVPGGERNNNIVILLLLLLLVVTFPLPPGSRPQLGRTYHSLGLDPGVKGGDSFQYSVLLLPSSSSSLITTAGATNLLP